MKKKMGKEGKVEQGVDNNKERRDTMPVRLGGEKQKFDVQLK